MILHVQKHCLCMPIGTTVLNYCNLLKKIPGPKSWGRVSFISAWCQCLPRGTLNKEICGPLCPHSLCTWFSGSTHALHASFGPTGQINGQGSSNTTGFLLHVHTGGALIVLIFQLGIGFGHAGVTSLVWKVNLCFLPCSAIHVNRVHLKFTCLKLWAKAKFSIQLKSTWLSSNILEVKLL